MNWVKTSDRLPTLGQDTLIYTDGRMYVSTFSECQVYGNDTVPYRWEGPGPFRFFGWEIKYWAQVRPPEEEA